MCDGIKDMELLRKQLANAINQDIDIVEIEFQSGKLKYRDRWSVKNILDKHEAAQLDLENPLKGEIKCLKTSKTN